jgi:hypothetical protein
MKVTWSSSGQSRPFEINEAGLALHKCSDFVTGWQKFHLRVDLHTKLYIQNQQSKGESK